MSVDIIQQRVAMYRSDKSGKSGAWNGLTYSERMCLSRIIAEQDGTYLKPTDNAVYQSHDKVCSGRQALA